MATREEIYKAIENADAQGDSAAVNELSAYLATIPASGEGGPLQVTIGGNQEPTAPDNSVMRGIGLGITKPLDNLARGITGMLPDGVNSAIDSAGAMMGMPSTADAVASNDAARSANTQGGAQLIGNIIGTLPTLAIPGGAMTQGAAGGALLSNADTLGGAVADAGLGALGGKAGEAAAQGLGKVIAPKMGAVAQYLFDKGVPLTIGQMVGQGSVLGKGFKAAEDKIAGTIPVLGDLINSARERGVNGFNRAVIDEVLKPIGVTLPDSVPTGHQAIAYARSIFNKGYDGVLSRMHVQVDQQYTDAMGELGKLAREFDVGPRFSATLKRIVDPYVDAGSQIIPGRDFKTIDSNLRKIVKSTKNNPATAELSGLLDATRLELRDAAKRASGPGASQALDALDNAYGNFVVLRGAAKSTTSGVFSPNQLSTAVRAADSSVGKGNTAEGEARMQKMSIAASEVLPSNVGDSGTTARQLTAAGIGAVAGGGALHGGIGIAPLAVGAAMSAPYTKLGQAAMQRLFNAGAGRIGVRNFVERIPAGAVAPPLLAQRNE